MRRIIQRVRRRHIKEVVVYGLVGVTALITQAITYSILCGIKMPPLLANFIGTMFGMGVSYYGHTRFTFQKTHHFSHQEFIKFIITTFVGLAISSFGIYIIVNLFKLNSYFGLLPMVMTPGITFLISKFWVFRK